MLKALTSPFRLRGLNWSNWREIEVYWWVVLACLLDASHCIWAGHDDAWIPIVLGSGLLALSMFYDYFLVEDHTEEKKD